MGVLFVFVRLQNLDNKVIERIGKLHKPLITKVMILSSKAGTFGTIWWLISVPFMIKSQWRVTGLNIIAAMCVSFLIGEVVIKHIVKRVRPCHSLDEEEQLIMPPRFYSFPSGHTTVSFAVVGVALLRCSLPAFLPIFVIASMIGFSRIYLRVHYLTDVLCGVILGLTCGIFSVLIFNKIDPILLSSLLA